MNTKQAIEREALLAQLQSIRDRLGESVSVAARLTGTVAKEQNERIEPCCILDEIDEAVEAINDHTVCLTEHLAQIASRLS